MSQDRMITFGTMRAGDIVLGIDIDHLSEVCHVSALRPLLVKSSYLCGGFNLRGNLIPVLDLGATCGFVQGDSTSKLAVILRHQDRLLAIIVDEVVGISEIGATAIQKLETEGSAEYGSVTGVFLDGGKPVSVVNVPDLFTLPDVYSVTAPKIPEAIKMDRSRVPMITFEAGGAVYSIPAIEVYGTVPRQTIEVNSMTSGPCLGSITYHQYRVPVVCTVSVLGLGRKTAQTSSEIVIMRCADDKLLGLSVDVIHEIEPVDVSVMKQVPGSIARRNPFLSQLRIKKDGTQIYNVDFEALRQDTSLKAIASLSTSLETETGPDPLETSENTATLREKKRYLVFEAGTVAAVPLSQVSCILEPPEAIVPAGQNDSGLKGYFARLGASIPLVALSAPADDLDGSSQSDRVLLIGDAPEQVGFLVQRVFSIETSVWRHVGTPEQGVNVETLVQLGAGTTKRVLPLADLGQIAQRDFATRAVESPAA